MEQEQTDTEFALEVTEQKILKTEGFKSVKLTRKPQWHYNKTQHTARLDFTLNALNEHSEPVLLIKIKVTYSITDRTELSIGRTIALLKDGMTRCTDYCNEVTKKLYGPSIILQIPADKELVLEFEKSRSGQS